MSTAQVARTLTSNLHAVVQAISSANNTVSQEVGSFTSEANDMHNQTLDKISSYADQYEPTVHYYDRMCAPPAAP